MRGDQYMSVRADYNVNAFLQMPTIIKAKKGQEVFDYFLRLPVLGVDLVFVIGFTSPPILGSQRKVQKEI